MMGFRGFSEWLRMIQLIGRPSLGNIFTGEGGRSFNSAFTIFMYTDIEQVYISVRQKYKR